MPTTWQSQLSQGLAYTLFDQQQDKAFEEMNKTWW